MANPGGFLSVSINSLIIVKVSHKMRNKCWLYAVLLLKCQWKKVTSTAPAHAYNTYSSTAAHRLAGATEEKLGVFWDWGKLYKTDGNPKK